MNRYILLLLLITLVSCTSLSEGGSATDVGNSKISGIIVDENGLSDSNSTVRLVPDTFNVFRDDDAIVAVTKTRSDGSYEFQNIAPGYYNIEAEHMLLQKKLFHANLDLNKSDTVILPSDTLLEPGTIVLEINDLTLSEDQYAYIPGTSIAVSVDSTAVASGKITINNVPAALIESVVLMSTSDTLFSADIGDSLLVTSGDTTTNMLEAWGYNRNIEINVASTGLSLTQSLLKFPLPVQLNSSNFNFSEAQTGGEDIRFTNSIGALLFHEVEYWDTISKTALVWVLADSIPHSSTETIGIHWGNMSATESSNASSVFDTLLGYQAVWHFNEDAIDGTYNKNSGTVSNCSFPLGAMGKGVSFDGGDNFVEVPNRENLAVLSTSFSYSLWIRVEENNGDLDKILYKEPFGIKSLYGSVEAMVRNGQDFIGAKFGQESDFLNKWTFLVCTIDRDAHLLRTYTNGVFVESVDISAINDFSSSNSLFMSVKGEEFEGDIDEVRIYKGVLSTDYIQLAYESQKENSSLVKF